MKPQNPNDKTLEEASGSSAFFSCSADGNGVASDSEVQAPENRQGGDSSVNVHSVSKTFPLNDGNNVKIDEDKDGKTSPESDLVRKIDVSGDNLSLVVDFSGSAGEINPNSLCDNNTGSIMVKRNGDRAQEFSVGDFVWVSSENQSWWPAKVSDLNPDRKECLNVSYFGQNHSAWCTPAQLSPFHTNFEKRMKQSEGRRFSGAVEKAMEAFGKNLTLVLARSCVSGDYNNQLGVFSEFSIDKLVPEEFLARLKNLAKFVSVPGMLELTIMKSRLSAFHLFIGHKQIPFDQLQEDYAEQSPGLIKGKPERKIQEGSKSKKRKREEDSGIKVKEGDENSADIENEKSFASRDRKKSKYLSYPYVNSNEGEDEKVPEITDQLVESPTVANRSSRTKRFQKNWLKKFITHENSPSTKALLVNASPANLLTQLRFSAVDCQCGNEAENLDLSRWFFSKFRFSVYHDESLSLINCKNSICATNLDGAGDSCADREQNIPKRKKKSKVKSLSVLSDMESVSEAKRLAAKDSPGVEFPQTPGANSAGLETLDKPEAELPDLNGRGAMLNSTALENSKNTSMFGSANVGKSGTKMLNFQGIVPCSADRIPNPGLTFDQPGSDGKISNFETNPEKKKRKRRKKGTEDHNEARLSSIPDLNGTTAETTNCLASAPAEKPKQRRRRRTKAEMMTAETAKGTTTSTLLLKFAPEMPMPSKDDLTSTFSGFGPLISSETQLLEEPGGAQVAFVSSADASEAVRSLEKSNPFGGTLISFQIQPKTPKRRKKDRTPKVPIDTTTSPVSKQGDAPMSVDQIRQKLVMMTTMLEKAGDSLSQEMRVQLECEIKRLLEKVSSMPSSSSS